MHNLIFATIMSFFGLGTPQNAPAVVVEQPKNEIVVAQTNKEEKKEQKVEKPAVKKQEVKKQESTKETEVKPSNVVVKKESVEQKTEDKKTEEAPKTKTVETPTQYQAKAVASAKCLSCKSVAEGVDKSASAKATSWFGLVIGEINGEKSFVITEADKLDHIKAYQQRSVVIGESTEIQTNDGEQKSFSDIDIGHKTEIFGSYDSKTRIINATKVIIY